MTTEQPEIDNTPGEDDKNFYLMMANKIYMKDFLMPNIKTFIAMYPDKTAKAHIMKIDETNRQAYNALVGFQQYMNKNGFSLGQKEQLKKIEQLYMDCAILPFVTPVEKMNDLAALIDNFHVGAYSRTGGEIIEAIQSSPDDYNAQTYTLIHTYLPDADESRKKALAIAIEKMFHLRSQLGF